MDLTRYAPFEVREVGEDGLTLSGYAAVFNQVTRIDSWEGRFDEQLSPGAFARGINAGKTPVLMFNHGKHPMIGDLPIGAIGSMREDGHGLFIEARLHDNDLVKPVRDAIASKAIKGMSFRFNVPKGKETWDRSAGREVPLRTITEVNCAELGPVTFPAYEGTDVAVRSLSDSDLDELAERLAARGLIIPGTPTTGPADTPQDQPQGTPRSTHEERARVLRELTLEGFK